MMRLVVSLVLGAYLWFPVISIAAEQNTYTIVIKNHKFEPDSLIIPTGQRVKVVIDNQDPTPEEFESYELSREKVVGAGKQVSVYIGPLKSGSYGYYGEFHRITAQGTIVAE